MQTPLQRGHGFFIGDFDEVQNDRLVRAERRAGGDAEQEGITDLAGRAGDGHANGSFAHKNFEATLCKCGRFEASFPRRKNLCLENFQFGVELDGSLKPAEAFPPPSQSNVWEPGENPGRLRHCNGYKLPMPP